MNIPETLRGKKAEGLGILILSVIENYMVTEATKLLLILEYIKFYLQPFTPSLIEELFEGWEKKNDWLYVYKHPDKPVRQISIEVNGEIWMNSMEVNPQPKTLSDFISACNNSGKLKWKEK